MNFDEQIARACEPVPGLLHGALALLPEGLMIGGVGQGGSFNREPLARSATRCLAHYLTASRPTADAALFVEHLFVGREELVVILQGRRYPQLALALRCTAEPNLAFVRSLSRTALDCIEATVDLAVWGL
jgi:hypothetical protein